MGRKTERLDLRIDPELREAIEQIAAARDRSVAWIVRDALKRYAEQEAGQPRPVVVCSHRGGPL